MVSGVFPYPIDLLGAIGPSDLRLGSDTALDLRCVDDREAVIRYLVMGPLTKLCLDLLCDNRKVSPILKLWLRPTC